MTSMHDRNARVIEEFRSNSGKVSGTFEGAPMLLLSVTGSKSGRRITKPLMYLQDGNCWFVFASKGGAPTNPDWFHNLVANPIVTLEIGNELFEAEAEVVSGQKRDRLYARQAEFYPQFNEYQGRTTRTIPVVELTRRLLN